jgi:hypothetical protein
MKFYPKLNNFRKPFGLIQGMALFVAIASLMGLGSCQETGFIAPLPQDLGSSLNTTRNEQNSRLSYDGRYLVFASDRGRQRGIWLYDLVERRVSRRIKRKIISYVMRSPLCYRGSNYPAIASTINSSL